MAPHAPGNRRPALMASVKASCVDSRDFTARRASAFQSFVAFVPAPQAVAVVFCVGTGYLLFPWCEAPLRLFGVCMGVPPQTPILLTGIRL